MGVGHHTTDEVGLSLVEGAHQVVQLALEVGGDGLASALLLPATVSYNLTGWLEKNKDPLNDTIVEMIKNGTNKLMIQCFKDHPGQPLEASKDGGGGGGKKKGGGKTVSSYFKGQLDDLMTTLYKTQPHFIRCVVPNTHKQPGGVESGLVMHQYQCNGVLAGIAICRAGFPNKVVSSMCINTQYNGRVVVGPLPGIQTALQHPRRSRHCKGQERQVCRPSSDGRGQA